MSRLAVVLLACCGAAANAAEPGALLWQMQTRDGEVLLLGSVHMLRPQDYPLAEAVESAYERADRVVLELDLGKLNPVEMQLALHRIGLAAEGETLESLMGPESWDRAIQLSGELGVELKRLMAAKPWYAALTVANLEMVRLGFRPEHGIEQYLTRRSVGDGKPIHGLETIDYQLGIFDGMPLADQRRLLLQTLEDARRIEQDMDGLIEAWNRGEAGRLGELLGEGFEDYGSLYDTLVVRRNREWLPQVEAWAAKGGTTLVVVGALHLVGEDSLIGMLKARGHPVRRLPWAWPGPTARRGGPAGRESASATPAGPEVRSAIPRPSRSLLSRRHSQDSAR